MGDDLPFFGEADPSKALPRIGDQPLAELLASDDNALARAIRRLARAPETYAAFGNAPHSLEL